MTLSHDMNTLSGYIRANAVDPCPAALRELARMVDGMARQAARMEGKLAVYESKTPMHPIADDGITILSQPWVMW